MNYQQWLNQSSAFLREKLKNDPYADIKRDVTLLLQTVTGKSSAYLLAFAETLLTPVQVALLEEKLQRRAKGEPMAYILGSKSFWTLDLKVSPDTLIPRPDTEILVENALEKAKVRLNSADFYGEHKLKEFAILDLGTGTGAIALALAQELQPLAEKYGVTLKVIGVDKIPAAVTLATHNAEQNHIRNVEFRQSHWFDALSEQKFDLIVANPPYIDPQDPHLQQGDVRFEPLSALISNQQGYADLRLIIEQAKHYIKPQGWLMVEHGWQQGEKVRAIFQANLWQQVETYRDYSDNERITIGKWEN